MISHFIHCPQANQHPHIVIYRDNEDPYLFYYINSHPRIKIDDATKNLISAYKANPTEENLSALKNQVEIIYDKAILKKKEKLFTKW